MHYEFLPEDSPHGPFRHAAVDNAGEVQGTFRQERDANYFIDMTEPDFDPESKSAIAEIDLREGTIP